ncbi:MAG: NAD(P)/FAD-dependent oxidoreductase [Pirellulaceae bacterium]
MNEGWDVIVTGAGAAGLFAAATAAARGRRTLLLEKNKKLGVKILMSGGTRCNITHEASWQAMADAFGKRQGRFLKFAMASLKPEDVVRRFHDLHVPTKVESTGKIFPQSDRAIDVRDALVSWAIQCGVEILNESPVTDIRQSPTGFCVTAGGKELECSSLIVTVGGQSYPGCGTTGDGYRWLTELGHTIVHPRPALTPLRIIDDWARELAGITTADVAARIQLEKPELAHSNGRASDRGSFLFTHRGCSGPVVLNLSRAVTDPAHNCRKQLVCDWLPELGEQQLRDELKGESGSATAQHIGSWLAARLPKRLAAALCQRAAVDYARPLAELSRPQIATILQQLKQCSLDIAGTLGFAKAEVTAGGLSLDEVDPNTMASRIAQGLFVSGEILDVDGPIGGYNFQAAFSTGFVAGNNA